MSRQATIAAPVEVDGIGLHSGDSVQVRLRPAPERTGIVFLRADLAGRPHVPALFQHVVDTTLATTLACGSASVATVEHLVAALVASRIDNVLVDVHGPELPVLDGSARPWMELLGEAGRAEQVAHAARIVVRRRVEVVSGERRASLVPSSGFEVAATIDFPHPLIGRQSLGLALENGEFGRELAWARTFGFAHEVDALRRAGLARGGSLDNAVVYGDAGVMNPEGLRAPDEPVRHKLLDLVGDLGLLGARLQGRLEAVRPGHGITLALLRALLADPDAYSRV